MRIGHVRALDGPNIYHHRPVLLMQLDLEEASGLRTDQIPGFVERLLAVLPALDAHRCSVGKPGGFVQRLAAGTYLGHVVEHVALELSGPAGIGVGFGKTIATDAGVFRVIVRYRCEAGMRYLLSAAVEVVDDVLNDRAVSIDRIIENARRIVARHALGPSTQAIANAATRRNIPWRRVGPIGSLLRLGWGKNIEWIKTAVSGRTSLIAAENAQNKELTKQLLREAHIPVPRGAVVHSADEAIAALQRLTAPVVIKPLAGNHGRGCTLLIRSDEQAKAAYEHAAAIDRAVLVEEQISGRDYRIVIVGGKMVAASERKPAHVVGDGVSNIAQLIERENRNPMRGVGHGMPLTRIAIDDSLVSILATRGLTLDSVPLLGHHVQLRDTANLSTGGTAVDVTDAVHSTIAAMCVRAAGAIGIDICGIDYISPDITCTEGGAIIEINAGPGLRMHHYPSAGKVRDVGGAIVDMLYPKRSQARIPLVAVTGTNGKTTVTRLVSHVLAHAGKTVGMACTDGIWIGGTAIAIGDSAGPGSTRAVLADRSVDVAVVEAARGGILRRGLGYDWADVGVVTNVHEDHIGQDGIKSIGDLVRIKALIAARVRRAGTLVLNADNGPAARMARLRAVTRTKKRIVYFSLSEDTARIRRHIGEGHPGYLVHDGWIVEADGSKQGTERNRRVVALNDVPATLGGVADFNTSNVLAAVAACRALGIEAEVIADALRTFTRVESNRGRANVYQVHGGYAMVDYGHNAHAYDAIGSLIAKLPGYFAMAVIDMPGDRADSVIQTGARAAGRAFNRVIVHKPHNARGRKPGDVAMLIENEIKRSAPECECVMEADEQSAVETALRGIGPGQIVVLFYERIDWVQQALERHGAVAVDRIPLHSEPQRDQLLARNIVQTERDEVES